MDKLVRLFLRLGALLGQPALQPVPVPVRIRPPHPRALR